MSAPIAPFPERYRRALANARIRRNLLSFQRSYVASRAAVFERFGREGGEGGVRGPSFEVHRGSLARATDTALGYRAAHLARFTANAEAARPGWSQERSTPVVVWATM